MAGTLEGRHLAVDRKLQSDVSQLWGSSHVQKTATLSNGSRIENAEVKARLNLDYRKKGHYWYSTYTVGFEALYQLPKDLPSDTTLLFPLPAGSGLFNDFQVKVDGQSIENYQQQAEQISIPLSRGTREVGVTYLGRGSREWWYYFESNQGGPRNLHVLVETDFGEYDFIDGSVSPDKREAKDDGWQMEWSYKNLLSGSKIGISLPEKSNPGPALIDICRFAPLGLLLFFIAVAVSAVARGQKPHPVHFFLLGTGFFSFHLLLVYLSDAVGVPAAFVISSLVAVFLNYSYASQALDRSFARFNLLPASVLYLVLFSAAFLVEEYRGLLLVLLLVFSLFLLMRISAHLDWHAIEQQQRKRQDPVL